MGSGKTTAAKLLSRHLKLHLLEENFGENDFLSKFYQDMKRWAFHSQTFFLMEKTRQLLDAGRLLKEAKNPLWKTAALGIIQDTPIQQDAFSYAKALHVLGSISDAEWHLYQKIYLSFVPYFPVPDLIIYLETSIPAISQRISTRARSYEKSIPTKYLKLLDKLNHVWLSENKTIPVLTVHTDKLNIVSNTPAQLKFVNLVKTRILSSSPAAKSSPTESNKLT